MPIEISPSKLHKAVEVAEADLKNMRIFRNDALREFTGRFYNTAKDDRERPINLTNHFVSTIVPHLANQNPKHDVRTDFWHLRAEARLLSMALDRLSEQLDLVGVSRRNLMEALIAPCGIVKVTLRAGSEQMKIRGRWVDLGQPCVQRIDFDDYICDMSARDFHDIAWEGHKYLVTRAEALEFAGFDDEARAVIEKIPSYDKGERDEHRPHTPDDRYELLDLIQLQDVYLYDETETIVVTMPCDGYRNVFLREELYEGPGRSPFERLELCPLPGRAMGMPPIAMMREQGEILTDIMNKITDQARRTKSVLAYEAAGEDDALHLSRAGDGDTTRVDNLSAVEHFQLGGVQAPLVQYAGQLLSFYNMQSGSPDVLAGSPGQSGSKTATEYSGRLANANVRIQDFSETHSRFHDRVSGKLAFYLVTDPFIRLPMVHRIPGAEDIELVYDAQTRQGEPDQFTYRIKRRSMQQQDPAIQTARMNELFGTVMNAAQVQATTGLIDAAAVARRGGDGLGIEELDEIVLDPMLQQFAMMAATPDAQAGAMGGKGRPATAPGAGGGGRNRYAVGDDEGARETQGQVRGAYEPAAGGA